MSYLQNNGMKFDSIIATEVIEHLNDEQLTKTIKLIKNSLSDNGIAIFTTPNKEDLSKSMIYCPEADCVFHRWQHVRSWSEESLKKYLSTYFDDVSTFIVDFQKYGEPIPKKGLKYRIKKILFGHTESNKVDTPYNPNLIAIVTN